MLTNLRHGTAAFIDSGALSAAPTLRAIEISHIWVYITQLRERPWGQVRQLDTRCAAAFNTAGADQCLVRTLDQESVSKREYLAVRPNSGGRCPRLFQSR